MSVLHHVVCVRNRLMAVSYRVTVVMRVGGLFFKFELKLNWATVDLVVYACLQNAKLREALPFYACDHPVSQM